MKAFGYCKEDWDTLLHLQEVTFTASAEDLREMAHFFTKTAHQMEKDGEDFGHEHFQDFCKKLGREFDREDVDIIIAKGSS